MPWVRDWVQVTDPLRACTCFDKSNLCAGLLVVATTFAVAPLYFKYRGEGNNLTKSPKPLTGSQIMRGAYINSGSKDVGPDPDWVDGKYIGRSVRNFQPSEEEIAALRKELDARRAQQSDKLT